MLKSRKPLFLFAFLFAGPNVLTGKIEKISTGSEGAAVVFFSAKCPCSNSHFQEVNDLAQSHSGIQFVGVHSNSDEPFEQAQSYFKSKKISFPVISDSNGKLAEQYKAFKTPHAFLLNSRGEVVYAGGVSNSADGTQATEKPFRNVIEDLKQGRSVRVQSARTLGCVIKRKKS
jgi:peroxiredoxin